MPVNQTNRVFRSIKAVHVFSKFDVIVIQQGALKIKLPVVMVPMLQEALRLAEQGEV